MFLEAPSTRTLRAWRRWTPGAVLGLVANTGLIAIASTGLMACAGASGATTPALAPTSSQADDDAAADVTEHHRHHHHGGVTMFIAMSLDTLAASPEQRAAIERIQGDLFQEMEPARAAEAAVLQTLADGIAAGTIDATKVNAALAQLTAASSSLHDAAAEALNQLHAVLTPEERAALVDKVEAHWALRTLQGALFRGAARRLAGAVRLVQRGRRGPGILPAALVHRDRRARLLRGTPFVFLQRPLGVPRRRRVDRVPRGAEGPGPTARGGGAGAARVRASRGARPSLTRGRGRATSRRSSAPAPAR
jgi:Spy/CpxP family protein refolding chaperone